MAEYWAHSDPEGLAPAARGSTWQPLRSHLTQVAKLAESFARAAAWDDARFVRLARAVGLLHDLGKYTEDFQRMILGLSSKKAPHSVHGAAIARQAQALEAAFAAAGHHAGLPDPKGGRAGLWERTEDVKEKIGALWGIAAADCPELRECLEGSAPLLTRTPQGAGDCEIRTRMLFSCLVDADRLDTSGHYRPDEGTVQAAPLSAAARLERLRAFVETKAARVPEGAMKAARRGVLEACLAAANRPGNLFSLTVPTGGAKTLASMAFALERARLFPESVRRIIVVIPYLSIIEQNAQVFIDALGRDCVLEHHSGNFERLQPRGEVYVPMEPDDEERYRNPAESQATENWDAPVIVTTSVRFFESLFSNRPSDLRRMHNIARSVVILDEVQTLPRQFVGPILDVMRSLADQWKTTFLFCTATQPAFEKSPDADAKDERWEPGTIQEVIPQPDELFERLRRVEVSWPGEARTPWSEVADGMLAERRALCIVNTRDQAALLYCAVKRAAQARGFDQTAILHLSTRMCAAHRLARIAEIRRRLDDSSEGCLVVSTQLVEAGVDLDFPVVYRAMGPLDSIAQAAGRCDREGTLTAAAGKPAGRVIVFETEDGKLPPGAYGEATTRTRALAREGILSIDRPDHVRQYFDRLYGEADLDAKEIQELRRKMKFREVAHEFEMIADNTQSVFVPYDAAARELIARLEERGILDIGLRRALQRYVVGLYAREFQEARRGGVHEVRPGSDLWVCSEGFYDENLGFVTRPTPEEMVL